MSRCASWVWLLLLASACAGALGSSPSPPASHGGGGGTENTTEAGTAAEECEGLEVHSWFNDHYEYFHLENWVLAALVVITMIFEACWHKVIHWVEHSGHLPDEEPSISEMDAAEISLVRDTLVKIEPSGSRPQTPEEQGVGAHMTATSSERCMLKESSLSSFAAEVHQDFRDVSKPLYSSLTERCAGELMVLGFLAWVVWCTTRAGTFYKLACGLKDVSHITLPPLAEGWTETIEDVHMHLFLSMVSFIGVLAVSVLITRRVCRRWQQYDTVIMKAIHKADPDKLKAVASFKDFWPKDQDAQNFMYFAKSRRLFFGRLAAHLADEAQGDHKHRNTVRMVTTALEELHSELSPDKPFLQEKLPEMMTQWFSFQDYAHMMCHYLMKDLVEVKTATWFFLCGGLITSALLLLATGGLAAHFTVIGIQLMVALVIGISVPAYLRRQHSEELIPEDKLKEEWTRTRTMALDEAKAVGIDDLPKLKLPKFLQVEDFPMFTMQLFIFLWCYNVVRMCGSNYWWYEYPAAAGVALAVFVITMPAIGVILGYIVSSMALIMARGDVGINDKHVAWVYVLTIRELEHTRRSKWIAARRAPPSSANDGQQDKDTA